jgi:hypothetical protein
MRMSDLMMVNSLVKRFVIYNAPDVGYPAALPVSTSTGVCNKQTQGPTDEKNES